ncbi:hypothetical protein LB518_17015 [Mesorhizobium sp. BR1-1-16]|uniref:hypothetical protein n=1 Tax=Mesorhizobium sp. BR1-1-16 TaxID=2876653 RepID=UPI001CCA6095|nr:hypothetical protein [Mesorhizobium sp. BR1-1-16]MBZ9938002.1 hypothetical protein [Mesorhizobium sp. BR1-1-16]
MQRERDFEPDVFTIRRPRPAIVDRATALFRPRDRLRPPAPLPLTKAERSHYVAADFVFDHTGVEHFRGLNRLESLDYIDLQRVGLDNDDEAFLRLIQLGDRHASAMRIADDR